MINFKDIVVNTIFDLDINLSKEHYRKILKCGILVCKDNYRGIIYNSEKKEY